MLPREIPDVLAVDVRNLDLGMEIKLKDLPLPESAELLDDPNTVVVLAAEPKTSEAATSEGEVEQKEVEVLAKGKAKSQEEA